MSVSSASTQTVHKRPFALPFLAVIIVSVGSALLLLRPAPRENPSPTAPATLPTDKITAEPAASFQPRPSASPAVELTVPAPAPVTADSLETLAATDPARALDLALAEKDDAQRDIFLQAVLRGWAHTAPDAAADWAWANQKTIEQGHAFSAIFNGIQQTPDTAVRLAQRLATEHPEEAWSFGRYLVYSLAQVSHFAEAANYAATTHPDHLIDLLTAAYHPWGCQQPEKALQSAIALEDPLRQNAAFHATIDGWSQTNPQSLAEAAYKFPQGNDRSLALVAGLRRWIELDRPAAENWIKDHSITSEESSRAYEQ